MLGSKKDDSWMDIQKASKYCDVSPATLRRNLAKGLKASTTTGKMLFKKSDLEEWLNG